MRVVQLDWLLTFFTGMELLVRLLWLGLAVLTVALLILVRTRWGQFRPLRKCVILSLLAHVLLAGYATTVQIVAAYPQPGEPVIHLSLVDGDLQEPDQRQDQESEAEPWEKFPHEQVAQPEQPEPNRPEHEEPPQPQRRSHSELGDLTGDPPLEHLALAEAEQPQPEPLEVDGATGRSSPGKSPEQIEAPAAEHRQPAAPDLPEGPALQRAATPDQPQPVRGQASRVGVPTALIEQPVPLPRLAAAATTPEPAASLAELADRLSQPAQSESAASVVVETDHPGPEADVAYDSVARSSGGEPRGAWRSSAGWQGESDPGLPRGDTGPVAMPQNPRERAGRDTRSVPEAYSLRTAPDRSRLAERQGATPQTEEAVRAALRWLADNQEPDGSWDAERHGAGRELLVAGQDRRSAGIRADSGMTGLALLAFLASGHTHRQGPYRENVRRGLEYLLRVQAADGNLSGEATAFAAMYCHAMAACALSEAYGMTGDERLYRPVRRAVGYTVAAQDPSGGGFRYRPGDPGDTSQCGWQLMALRSAELAGIAMPPQTRNGIIRFLRGVSSGEHGGLASYRPSEPPSRPMTAEALLCWQLLGMPRENPAGNQAGDYLLAELPGQQEVNLYYWYYATLGMYQLQGAHWRRWNDALQATLLDIQRTTGSQAGSWDPETVWGCYGGRVYSTALATLCLEVYYRFLPLYDAAAPVVARAD